MERLDLTDEALDALIEENIQKITTDAELVNALMLFVLEDVDTLGRLIKYLHIRKNTNNPERYPILDVFNDNEKGPNYGRIGEILGKHPNEVLVDYFEPLLYDAVNVATGYG